MNSAAALLSEASVQARWIDHVTLGVLAVVTFYAFLIFSAILFFMARYRHTAQANRAGADNLPRRTIETIWIVVPTVTGLVLFAWSAIVYRRIYETPDRAVDVYVVAKQWMWKFQHANGKREIDQLHLPVGATARLLMTSQDVIHSFFVPAFRLKQDVLPGRYTSYTVTPTKPGTFHLFCSQYCGTLHSGMIGSVIVMKPAEYQRWLNGHLGQGGSMSSEGRGLFAKLACATCHRPGSDGRAPNLEGLFGRTVTLTDGRTVTADETYIRESILEPGKKVVMGYRPIMPVFKDQITEEQLVRLIEYIKSLRNEPDIVAPSELPLNPNKIEQMRLRSTP